MLGQRRQSYANAPDYLEYVRRLLEDRYGNRGPYELGLRIDTSLDLHMQHIAEQAVRNGLKALDRRRGYRGALRRLSEARPQSFLEQQERTLPKGGLAVGASVEALVARSSADQLRLRIGAAEAELPACGALVGARLDDRELSSRRRRVW